MGMCQSDPDDSARESEIERAENALNQRHDGASSPQQQSVDEDELEKAERAMRVCTCVISN